jgi:hypothetical protein
VKYLAPTRGHATTPPLTDACYFQNMRRYTWHLQFLQAFPELAELSYDGYYDLVLRRATRRLWAGAVRARPNTLHPSSGTRGVITYTAYAESGGLDAAAIVEVDRTLKDCMPFARDRLVFEPEGPDQAALVTLARADLTREGVATLLSPTGEAGPLRPSCPPGARLEHHSLTPLASPPTLADLDLPGPLPTYATVETAGTGMQNSVRFDVCRDSTGPGLRAIILRPYDYGISLRYVVDESITSPREIYLDFHVLEIAVPPAAVVVEGLTEALAGNLRPLRVRITGEPSTGLLVVGHAGFVAVARGRVEDSQFEVTSSLILVGGLAPGDIFAGLRCPIGERAVNSSFRLDTTRLELEACGWQAPGATQGYRITRLAVQDSSLELAEKDRARFLFATQAEVDAVLTYRFNHHNACDSFHLALPHADYAVSTPPAVGCGPQVPNAPMRTRDDPETSPLRYRIRYYGGSWREGDAPGCSHFLLCP